MDIPQLISAFQASLAADNEERMKAHYFLESLKNSAGLIPALLTISLSDYAMELRQISAIYLKNLGTAWKDSAVPAEDKACLRKHLLFGLTLSTPDKLRVQFQELAHQIALHEFPWEGVLEQLDEALASQNSDQIYAGLLLIQEISRVFEYILTKRRTSLHMLIRRYFGRLLELLQSLVTTPTESSYKYVLLILKTYWTSTYIDLPEELATVEVLGQWLAQFKAILDTDYTPYPENVWDTEDAPWTLKHWAVQILHRVFSRFFNVASLKPPHSELGSYFQTVWAIPVLDSLLPQLLSGPKPPAILANYFIKYVNQALKFSPTSQRLQSLSLQLITDVVLPYVSRGPEDEELWEDNPIEFIRKEADFSRAYYHPKSSATDLLNNLCGQGYLADFMEYVSQQLQSSPDLVRKEALLLAVGSLSRALLQSEQYRPLMQYLLANYVIGEFDSPVGFLRARACWMYAKFAKFPFENQEHQASALQKICGLLLDPALPVRVEAAIALPRILIWSGARERIATEVQTLIGIYLQIINEVDSVDLVDALEEIIDRFGTEITPFALEICQHLVQAFERMVRAQNNDNCLAAMGTITTLGKIVDALEEREEELHRVSQLLLPFFEYTFSQEGSEYFEDALFIYTSLLAYAPAGTHVGGYAFENVQEIGTALGNLAQKYPALALEHLSQLAELATHLLSQQTLCSVIGAQFAVLLLENLPDAANTLFPFFLGEIAQILAACEDSLIRRACFQTITVCLGQDPLLALQHLSEASFTEFAQIADSFKSVIQRKYVVQAAGALLGRAEQLPPYVTQALPGLLATGTVFMAKLMQKQTQDEPDAHTHLRQAVLQQVEDEGSENESDNLDLCSETKELYEAPIGDRDAEELLQEHLLALNGRNTAMFQALLQRLDASQQAYLFAVLHN